MKPKVLDVTLISLFAVIISLCSWLSIPAAVPFTLQLSGVFLALLILGGKKGTLAVGLYILLGCIGLPVFHSFTAGIGIIAGPTGGFITGFLILGLIYHLLTKKKSEGSLRKALALLTGLIVCWTLGCLQFTFINDTTVKAAFLSTVLPFVIPDLIKLTLSVLLADRLRKIKQI